MLRLLKWLAGIGLPAVVAIPLLAQVSNPSILPVSSDPTGTACTAGLPNLQNTATGYQYSCQNIVGGVGTYALLGGGGISGVTSFAGRTGAVTPATGDYSFSQLSGSPSASQIASAGTLTNNISGNAATATSAVSAASATTAGIASTASALASTPTQCTGSLFSTGIAANGNANCAAIPTTGVTSFNTRTGAVVPAAGDYTFSLIGGTLSSAQVAAAGLLSNSTSGTASNLIATSNSTLTTLPSLALPYSQLSGTPPTWNQSTTGNAATATALAVTPTGCSTNQFAISIAASGNLGCTQPLYSQLGGTVPTWNQSTTGNSATATALLTSPTQCSGAQFATGITSAGNANCSPVSASSLAQTTGVASAPAFVTPCLAVTYSASLTIPITNGCEILTLTGNVTSSTIAAGTDGQRLCLDIVQNATTPYTFVFPASNIVGTFTIGVTLGKRNQQCFVYSQSLGTWAAESWGIINA
jgi:hypothetical protein